MAEDIFQQIVLLRSRGIRMALATIISRKGATPRKDTAKMLVDEQGKRYGTLGGGMIEDEVCCRAVECIQSGSAEILSFDLTGVDVEESGLVCGGHMEVYLEPIVPDPILYILGAGNVCKALSESAGFAGFRIAVADDRGRYVNKERFPDAESFYVADHWDHILRKIDLNDNSYVFISTRDHSMDALCMHFALRSQARYIGMLGSGKKIALLKKYLEEHQLDPDQFQRVSIPVGFDIGAETPEEIAISIVVELIAARKNRNVSRMRDAVRNSVNISGKTA
ncbi:MAG: XdhC family protein [Acidobacteriota bacterium]|jgi:xanthine dehydrogenase accessory factor